MHRAHAISILVDESRSLSPLVGITRIYAARDHVQEFDPHPVRLHVRWDSLGIPMIAQGWWRPLAQSLVQLKAAAGGPTR